MAESNTRPTILITGAAGGFARMVARLLEDDYEIIGVDSRPLIPGQHFPGDFFKADYTKRKIADVFRDNKIHALVHLGRIRMDAKMKRSTRFNLNVLGTRHLLELAHKYEVSKAIVVSTFHVYGAHPDNHLSLTEDDPLRATQTFPEIVDATELDHVATAFLLRNPEVQTIVLRPCNIIGSQINNRISAFLRADYCPSLMGYDPPMQFLHESDFAHAIELALRSDKRGVFNVAGEGVIPFTRAVHIAGGRTIPVPHLLAYPMASMLKRLGGTFPKHLIDFFRYPTLLADVAFRREFGYEPRVSTMDALKSIRSGWMPPTRTTKASKPHLRPAI